jgi:DNA-binding MarR family transcriptional regulator
MTKPTTDAALFVGALLRLCYQQVRERMIEAIQAAGFTDLDEAYFPMFTYPPPNAARPSELARRFGMSRQAVNYLITQLEVAGYLQRRTDRRSGRRLVYLTSRGWQVIETMYAAARQLQAEWADEVGRERFAQFMDVLTELSSKVREGKRTPAVTNPPTGEFRKKIQRASATAQRRQRAAAKQRGGGPPKAGRERLPIETEG